MTERKYATRELTITALFTGLIAVGAFLKVPVPLMDYFTLQSFFVVLAGLLLGPRLGALAAGVYLILGLVGFPVFAAGGGLSYIFRPTFGYLLGFPLTAYVIGKLCSTWKIQSFRGYFGVSVLGLSLTYILGFLYKFMILNFYLHEVTPFLVVLVSALSLDIPGDIVLCIIAAALIPKLKNVLNLEIVYDESIEKKSS